MDYYCKNVKDYKPAMGERLRACRLKSHLTQEKMAEILDISVKHYSEVERGLIGLSVDKLIYVSNMFGVSLDHLLKGSDADEGVPYLLLETYRSCPEEKREYLIELVKQLNLILHNTNQSGRRSPIN